MHRALQCLTLQVESTAADAAARARACPLMDAAAFLDGLAQRRLLARKPPVAGKWPLVSIIVAAWAPHWPGRTSSPCWPWTTLAGSTRSSLWMTPPSRRSRALAGLPVRLLRQEHNIGQSAARNLAAAEAQGELLAFIDNDCVADPPGCGSGSAALMNRPWESSGVGVIAPPAAGRVRAFEAVRLPLDMGAVGGPVGPAEIVAYLPTCNLIVRRDLLLVQEGSLPTCALARTWILSGARCGLACAPAMRPAGRSSIITAYASDLRRRADYGSSEADL